MLSDDERSTIAFLEGCVGRQNGLNRVSDSYYNGEQHLDQLGLAIPPQLRKFLTIVAWPNTYTNAVEERIDLEGFELPGETDASDELWSVWQANHLDEQSSMLHIDAFIRGIGFVIVGPGDGTPDADEEAEDRDSAIPLITIESSSEVAVTLSPRTKTVESAVKVYRGRRDRYTTLYLPNETIWCEYVNGVLTDVARDKHNMGYVPVVPFVYGARTDQRHGRSGISRIIGVTDAAARALTNAQIATELLAIPQRYVVGASESDFVGPDGKPKTAWETYLGAIWGLGNENAKPGQFTAADLSNFETIVNHYAKLASSLTGLPMRYLGQATTNPPSAEGIMADESRLVKTCERYCRSLGESWETVMRISRRIMDGKWDKDLAKMETQWRNPATPTRAQAADAAVKLVAANIIPREFSWKILGYSAVERELLRKLWAEQDAADPVREIAANLAGTGTPLADPNADPNVPGVAPAPGGGVGADGSGSPVGA
jgi:hypothetical protein